MLQGGHALITLVACNISLGVRRCCVFIVHQHILHVNKLAHAYMKRTPHTARTHTHARTNDHLASAVAAHAYRRTAPQSERGPGAP